jgi:hypothetical protein
MGLDVRGFGKSVSRDVQSGLKKWITGRTTLDFMPSKPTVTHVQGLAIFLGFMVILGVMFSYQAGAIKVGAQNASGPSGGGGGKPVTYGSEWTASTGSGQASGNVAENSDIGTQKQQITELNLAEMSFTLTWTDEPDHDRLHPNQPDELGIEVVSPSGENQSLSAKNPMGGQGKVVVNFTIQQTRFNGDIGTGDWNYTVFAKECGNNTPKYVGLLQWLDNGNAYTLEISWKYFEKTGKS